MSSAILDVKILLVDDTDKFIHTDTYNRVRLCSNQCIVRIENNAPSSEGLSTGTTTTSLSLSLSL